MLLVVTLGLVSSACADTNAVASVATIWITGEVKRPGEYAFREGETLTQAIDRAGGFANEFTSAHVCLFRYKGGFDGLTSRFPIKRWSPNDDPSGWGALSTTNRPKTNQDRDCITVNVRGIRRGKDADIPLKKGDWITLRRGSE